MWVPAPSRLPCRRRADGIDDGMLSIPAIRKRLSLWRRRGFEALGQDRYSRPGLNGLDRRIERWVDRDGGCFIEAGANDGYLQSNTYYLERRRGWHGLLVEPLPTAAARCRIERPHSIVIQAALVAPTFTDATIPIQMAGLMSVSGDKWEHAIEREEWMAIAREVQNLKESPVLQVPARTLSSLIDEAQLPAEIDLLSIDVEGAEQSAIQGLDLTRHAPRFICIETHDTQAMDAVLASRYDMVEVLTDEGSYQDRMYRRRA